MTESASRKQIWNNINVEFCFALVIEDFIEENPKLKSASQLVEQKGTHLQGALEEVFSRLHFYCFFFMASIREIARGTRTIKE